MNHWTDDSLPIQMHDWLPQLASPHRPWHHFPYEHQTKWQSGRQEPFAEWIVGSGGALRSLSGQEERNIRNRHSRWVVALQDRYQWPSFGGISSSHATALGAICSCWRWCDHRSHSAWARCSFGLWATDHLSSCFFTILSNHHANPHSSDAPSYADSRSNASLPATTSALLSTAPPTPLGKWISNNLSEWKSFLQLSDDHQNWPHNYWAAGSRSRPTSNDYYPAEETQTTCNEILKGRASQFDDK